MPILITNLFVYLHRNSANNLINGFMDIHLNVTLTDYEVDQLKIGLQRYSDYLMSQNRFLTASMIDVILDKFGLLIESR